jgi:hypothetical protein
MTRLLLDAELAGRLGGATEHLQLCDPSGKFLGIFVPAPPRDLYRAESVPFTEEELDAAEKETGGRSLAAILADLEKR